MPRPFRFTILIILCLLCLLTAAYLLLAQKARFDTSLTYFPAGSSIAGIPVGGMDTHSAGLRLVQTYALTPIELRIGEYKVQMIPAAAGIQLDLPGMLQPIEQARGQAFYWKGFWDYLLNRPEAAYQSPLICSVAKDRIQVYLEEQIATRYLQLPTHASPILGDVLFQPGQPGKVLDLNGVEEKVQAAMCSATQRTVELNSTPSDALPPVLEGLGPMLETLAQVSTTTFDGMIEVYFQDLKSGKEVNFALYQGREVRPGIAFTGASTIKIPVMISAYKNIDGEMPEELKRQMGLMIDLSDNGSTDEVMKQVLDPNIGPIQVTQDMQSLGMKNTFLAGFFSPGAPLLQRYQTPANQRTDLSTDPDIYNQTTAEDMGRLLASIERCAADGSGPMLERLEGKVSQAECQEMIDLLAKNRKGVLLEAGLPEGTKIAHKYGWVTDAKDGLLHTVSDAAIVYTPGGNFVFTVYLYHAQQLPWEDAQRLVARLATAVDNFYNHWN